MMDKIGGKGQISWEKWRKWKLVLEEYVRNGMEGAPAYQSVYNQASHNTAKSWMSRILAEPVAKDYLLQLQNQERKKKNRSAGRMIDLLWQTMEKNIDYNPDTAIKYAAEINKMMGNYAKDEPKTVIVDVRMQKQQATAKIEEAINNYHQLQLRNGRNISLSEASLEMRAIHQIGTITPQIESGEPTEPYSDIDED